MGSVSLLYCLLFKLEYFCFVNCLVGCFMIVLFGLLLFMFYVELVVWCFWCLVLMLSLVDVLG